MLYALKKKKNERRNVNMNVIEFAREERERSVPSKSKRGMARRAYMEGPGLKRRRERKETKREEKR